MCVLIHLINDGKQFIIILFLTFTLYDLVLFELFIFYLFKFSFYYLFSFISVKYNIIVIH